MSGSDSSDGSRHITRRSFLGATGAAVATTTAAVGTASAYHEYYDVVDVVEAGADNEGDESITPLLRELAGDRVGLKFPPGEYLMDEQLYLDDYDKFGMFGNDATIRPAQADEFSGPARLFKLGTYANPIGWVRVEGIDFDFTPNNTGLRALQVQAEDLYVDDVHAYGQHDTGTWGPYLFDVLDPGSISMVSNTTANGGGKFASNTPQEHYPAVAGEDGPTGIIVSPYHEGKLWFRNCELGGFPGNGLYSSGAEGTVVVKGGEYRNSNVANIRLDGDHCYVKDVRIVVDRTREQDINQIGIRFDDGSDFWVYDTDIEMPSATGEAIKVTNAADSAIVQQVDVTFDHDEGTEDVISVSEQAGDVTIHESTIDVEAGGQAIQIQDSEAGSPPALVEDLSISGGADGGFGGSHAIHSERDGSRFYDLRIDQPGDAYRRCLTINGDDCIVAFGSYQSTHTPIVVQGDDAIIAEVTAQAYNGYESIKLASGSDDVEIFDSTIYNGIRNWTDGDVETSGNEFPS